MIYSINGRASDISQISKKLETLGHIRDDKNPKIVFSVGGDGTILETVHKYMDIIDKVKIVGINYGKLGFYTDFSKDEFDSIVKLIESNKYEVSEFNFIEYELINSKSCKVYYALNEVALISPVHTQIIDVYINDSMFETFRGTGLIVSTPTGSTAYNKSVGGSVMDPSIKSIQLAEIAPINNRVYKTLSSPIVLSSTSEIKLTSNFNNTSISYDGIIDECIGVEEIKIKLSKKAVSFIIKENTNFWDRVKKSFLN